MLISRRMIASRISKYKKSLLIPKAHKITYELIKSINDAETQAEISIELGYNYSHIKVYVDNIADKRALDLCIAHEIGHLFLARIMAFVIIKENNAEAVHITEELLCEDLAKIINK